jgi:hypothetical protein
LGDIASKIRPNHAHEEPSDPISVKLVKVGLLPPDHEKCAEFGISSQPDNLTSITIV